MTLTDGFIALLAACMVVLWFNATATDPSRMLAMFSGPQLTGAEVPTVYADPKPYKRKP